MKKGWQENLRCVVVKHGEEESQMREVEELRKREEYAILRESGEERMQVEPNIGWEEELRNFV